MAAGRVSQYTGFFRAAFRDSYRIKICQIINIFIVNCSPRPLEVTLPVLTQLHEKNKGTGLLFPSSLHTFSPFWLVTFSERGYAFSRRMARDLSLGITVKLSYNNETICPFGKLLTWARAVGFGYNKYKWVLFGFFFLF